MRKYSLVASLAVVLASQGCSLKIPTGLLNGSFLTPTTAPGGTVTTAGAACKDVFAKLDTNKDGSISEAEYKAGLALNSLDPATFDVSVEFKKRDANGDGKLSADEVAQGCTVAPGPEVKPPQPMPPIKKPPVTTAACTRGAIEVLDRYDANHNKSLEFEEFMGWYQAMARTQGCNGPIMDDDLPRIIEHGGGPNAGNIIANGAGGLQGQRHVMQQAGSTIAIAGHGVIISNNSGLLIAGQGGALITNNGGGLIANNGTGLVSGNGGGLISNNTGGWMTDGNGGTPSDPGINEGDMPRPMPACGPLPDPKTAFSKADLNGDGRIDLQELCQFPFFAPGVPIGIDPMPPVMPPIGNDCKNGFQRADLNHDGFVTPDEFFKARGVPFDGPQLNANQALPQAFVDAIMISNKGDFARRDRNGDGRIDGGEWCGYDPKPIPMPVPSYRPKPRPQPAECDLSYADLDGDGFVSWEEYYGANTPVFEGVDDVAAFGDAKGFAYAGFKGLDRNGDGLLDQSEVCAAPMPIDPVPVPKPSTGTGTGQCGSLFDTWDGDGDQTITFDEYADAKWAELKFIKAPSAEDEKATRARFFAEAKQFDANGNGSLDFVEFLKICPVYVPNSVAITNGATSLTPALTK